jgi:hypothetical protein
VSTCTGVRCCGAHQVCHKLDVSVQTTAEQKKLDAILAEYAQVTEQLQAARLQLDCHRAPPQGTILGMTLQPKAVNPDDLSIRDAARQTNKQAALRVSHAGASCYRTLQTPNLPHVVMSFSRALGTHAGNSPEQSQSPGVSRAADRGQMVHVHVDAEAMRTFLAEWKERGCQGDPPSGIRIMSQCAGSLRLQCSVVMSFKSATFALLNMST